MTRFRMSSNKFKALMNSNLRETRTDFKTKRHVINKIQEINENYLEKRLQTLAHLMTPTNQPCPGAQLRGGNYRLTKLVTHASSKLCLFTNSGPDPLRENVVETAWISAIEDREKLRLRSSTNQNVKILRTIMVHLCMEKHTTSRIRDR